jgi:hypothetical protein
MVSQRSWQSLDLRGYRRSRCLLIFFVLLALPLSATTYYVDNCVTVGSDSNNGTSTSTPWLTVAHVNAQSFNPGDSVLFQKTCTWREQLTIPSSGTSGNQITFGSYGSGALPVFNGANLLASGWTLDTGNIWEVAITTQPNQLFFNGTRGTLETSIGSITAPNEWYWASNVLYVYSTSNPATAFTGPGIEASQRNYAIYGSSTTYVTISGLELDKSNGYGGLWCGSCNNLLVTGVNAFWNYEVGISIYEGSGVVVTQSTAAYNGSSGLGANTSPGILFDRDVSHDNCSLPNGAALNGGIYMYGSSPNATVQYSYFYNNGVGMGDSIGWYGLGIWADTVGTGFTAKYNLVANNNEEGIRVEASTEFSVLYNVVYGTGGTTGAGWAGIDLAGNQSAHAPMSNSFVIGNTVYGGTSQGLIVQGSAVAGGCTNNTVENNIFVHNDQGASTYVNFWASGGCENITNGSGNVYNYNSFDTAVSDFIEWGVGTYYATYATWEAATGGCGTTGCSHSIQTAPTFANASVGNFTLVSGSSAIDAGTNLGSTYQMSLDPRTSFPWGTLKQDSQGSGWEIGAFVFVQQSSPAPPTSLSATVK